MKLTKSNLKQLKKIAQDKHKNLNSCLNQAVQEFIILEKATQEALNRAGVLI